MTTAGFSPAERGKGGGGGRKRVYSAPLGRSLSKTVTLRDGQCKLRRHGTYVSCRVTIHQRQQIVINKAQLKARGRTDGQAGTVGRRWIYFSADAKAVCESLSRQSRARCAR